MFVHNFDPITLVLKEYSQLIDDRTHKTVAEAHRNSGHENQSLTLDVSTEVVDILDVVLATFVIMEGKDKRKHDHHSATHADEDSDPQIPHDVASLVTGSELATSAIRGIPLGTTGPGSGLNPE